MVIHQNTSLEACVMVFSRFVSLPVPCVYPGSDGLVVGLKKLLYNAGMYLTVMILSDR